MPPVEDEDSILDALEENIAASKGKPAKAKAPDPDDDDDVIVDDEPPAKAESKDPPGFKSYEDYIKDGGDPDMYKGKKAYEAEHARIADNKHLRAEIKELKELSRTVVATMDEWKIKEAKTIRANLESELKEQKKSFDVDAALETQKKIDALDTDLGNKKPGLHPVIKDFIGENPILDNKSKEFNEDFFDDVTRLQAKKINAMSDRGGADLTPKQILRCTEAAFEEAKELHKKLFVSPRNERQGMGRQQSNQRGGDGKQSLEVRLKNMKGNSRNPELNGNAAYEMYQMIAEKDQKAADKYARTVLGE